MECPKTSVWWKLQEIKDTNFLHFSCSAEVGHRSHPDKSHCRPMRRGFAAHSRLVQSVAGWFLRTGFRPPWNSEPLVFDRNRRPSVCNHFRIRSESLTGWKEGYPPRLCNWLQAAVVPGTVASGIHHFRTRRCRCFHWIGFWWSSSPLHLIRIQLWWQIYLVHTRESEAAKLMKLPHNHHPSYHHRCFGKHNCLHLRLHPWHHWCQHIGVAEIGFSFWEESNKNVYQKFAATFGILERKGNLASEM